MPFQVLYPHPVRNETGKRIGLPALTRLKTDFGYRVVKILFCNSIILIPKQKGNPNQ